ncbi:MAG: ribonuclease H-like domain-containing protein [Lachnospiraceae bacterium]|nr:ribonuclease H-like domain-containing protein [Lachnospiraceae bacterium]
MIRRRERLEKEPDFDFDIIAPKERIVFFDIETTGLSTKNAALYLIGLVSYEDGAWTLTQFFAENMFEEADLLTAFFDVLNTKKKLGRVFCFSYNGDGFDIPFIKNCIRQYRLNYDFAGIVSVDLIKLIRPYKKLLGLTDCKLKTVEKLCGIFREDKYNGGELIYVYEEYLRLAAMSEDSCEYTDMNLKLKDKLLYTLLLHNAEDIADMPFIMGILGYEALIKGVFSITGSDISDGCWDIRARLEIALPEGIYAEGSGITVSIGEEDKHLLNIAVQLFNGELKYFFADYKNYYYLPAEDYAIHKSVGEFVDRKARKQATARTCYQKRSGVFVPQYEPVIAPVFYTDYKAQPFYGELTEYIKKNDGNIDIDITKRYIMSVIEHLKG